ncbi:efflux transporter outer membrane subunit [Variovorax dokdonensis]|uniref:Efflux transporter outer membrane subunit n=1 Tax=Variovorax dokdonensis TaxID=344883 RepID=A0ABT7NB84_9BURK|nr:efflux transporter outer membrane subunit [Variovorax dokdonensis]MDM0045211.1 efflux transporter outer membrane subunit [Variovorax dokdonensis]
MTSTLASRGMRRLATPLAALFAALVLAGCATPPPIDLQLDTPAQYKESVKPTSDRAGAPGDLAPAQDSAQWWTVFQDPQLEALVARAADRNTDVQQAAARLAQARALAREVDSARAPQVGLNASAARGAGIDKAQGARPASLFSAGLGASWELDLFGRLAGASRAASLDARSREMLLQSTRLAVQSETAQLYLAVRALDDEARIVRETVDAYRDTLDLTERRQRAGDVGDLDVERVRTELAATESDALAVQRQRAQVEHALAVVLGELPTNFSLDSTAWRTALPKIPAGLPSEMLARRPDVQAAQWRVQAAQERIGVAQAAWFPAIALTADGGYASTDLGELLKWSARSWGVGALFSLPLFDGGRREAGVQSANAEFDGAMAEYRAQVLGAFKDVEDQLSALRLLAQQSRVQAQAVDSARRATRLSDVRYREGAISQIDLLDTRRSELRNSRQALLIKAQQYQATVALVRALGGGWG